MRRILCITLGTFFACAKAEVLDGSRLRRRRQSSVTRSFTSCLLVEGGFSRKRHEAATGDFEETTWRCVLEDDIDIYYNLFGLPENFFKSNEKQLHGGRTLLTFSSAKVTGENGTNSFSITIPRNATVGIQPAQGQREDRWERHRRLTPKEGTNTVVVVRVIDHAGDAPTLSMKKLSDDVFGYFGDQHNLVSQYKSCSGGKLKLVPGEGRNVVRGVVEVRIPHAVKGQSFFSIQNWVTSAFPRVVGKRPHAYDHVLYVLPPGADMPFAGYAYYNSYLSLFDDIYVSDLNVLTHEIGHNFDMRHSGQSGEEYGDKTCTMGGGGHFNDDGPLMCFNGAKSYFTGWYSDRTTSITPSVARPQQLQLVGFDDYLNHQIKSSNQYVVAEIASSTTSLYLMYNRKEGRNGGVLDKSDQVTIVSQNGPTAQSWLLGGLKENDDSFRYRNWNGDQYDLVVQVCERVFGNPDYVRVSVYVDNGRNTAQCGTRRNGDWTNPPPPIDSEVVSKTALRVTSVDDDYREDRNGQTYNRATKHRVFATQNWNKFAYRFSPGKTGLPAGAVIKSAAMWVYPSDDDSDRTGVLSGYIVGNDVGNAKSYAAVDKQITNARKTDAQVAINPAMKTWSRGKYQKLVDVAPVLEEIIRREDYEDGNAIQLFLIGQNNRGHRAFYTFDNEQKGPRLSVTYSLTPIADPGDGYTSLIASPILFDAGRSRGPITRYTWEFGDGTRMSSEFPTITHSYRSTGSYRVRLTVRSSNGEKDAGIATATIVDSNELNQVELEVKSSFDDYVESTDGKVKHNAKQHELWSKEHRRHVYRFRSVPIPQGAEIVEARLEMKSADNSKAGNSITGIIRGEAVDNASPYSTVPNQMVKARKTQAKVTIRKMPQWTANKFSAVGNVAPIVQEIVNRRRYKAGNAIKLFLISDGSIQSPFRVVETADSGAGAKLIIRYRPVSQ